MKKLLPAITALLILTPNFCLGAIAFDSASKQTWAQATSQTFAHTVSGSNRVLITTTFTSGSGTDVSSVKYNGDDLTRLVKQSHASGSTNYTYVYYMTAPDTGTNNVVVALSGNINSETAATSYTGVDTANFPDAWTSHVGQSTKSYTLSLTTTKADCWIVAGLRDTDDATFNSGASRVSRTTVGVYGQDSDESLGAAGSKSFNWTGAANKRLDGVVLISLAPAGAAPAAATPKANIIYFE